MRPSGRFHPGDIGHKALECRMWDMSDCTSMASSDRRLLGNFFDLNFKSKVFDIFLDIMSLVG